MCVISSVKEESEAATEVITGDCHVKDKLWHQSDLVF